MATEWDLLEQLLANQKSGNNSLGTLSNPLTLDNILSPKKTYGFANVMPNLQNFGSNQVSPNETNSSQSNNTTTTSAPESKWDKFKGFMNNYGPLMMIGAATLAKPDSEARGNLSTAALSWQNSKNQMQQQKQAAELTKQKDAEERRRWDALQGLKQEELAYSRYRDKAQDNQKNAAIQATREQTRATQEQAEEEQKAAQEKVAKQWQLIQSIVENADPSEKNNLTRLQTSTLGQDDPDLFFKGYATPPKEDKSDVESGQQQRADEVYGVLGEYKSREDALGDLNRYRKELIKSMGQKKIDEIYNNVKTSFDLWPEGKTGVNFVPNQGSPIKKLLYGEQKPSGSNTNHSKVDGYVKKYKGVAKAIIALWGEIPQAEMETLLDRYNSNFKTKYSLKQFKDKFIKE